MHQKEHQDKVVSNLKDYFIIITNEESCIRINNTAADTSQHITSCVVAQQPE